MSISVRDQLAILAEIADTLESTAHELALLAKSQFGCISPSALECIELSKEELLDEIGAIRALVTDMQHAEDVRQTQQHLIRSLNEQHRKTLS